MPSLIPPEMPDPYGDGFRGMLANLGSIIAYIEVTPKYVTADELKAPRNAYKFLTQRFRSDLKPAVKV